MIIRTCPICGEEFEVVSPSNRRKYCSTGCAQTAEQLRKQPKGTAIHGARHTDYPIRYNPKQAQAAHDRQAEIERQARAAGLSYGRYQMMMYQKRLEEQVSHFK